MPDYRGWFGLEIGFERNGLGAFVSGLQPN